MKKTGCLLVLFLVAAAALFAQDKSDTSTAEDWKTNCSLRYEYSNKLIFSATETDTGGKKTYSWMAMSRSKFLAVFQNLALDRVPALKARRDKIVAAIGKAPGGGSVVILPELAKQIEQLWKDVEAAAKKHGVTCGKK